MSVLQFIASLVNSLAWPIVVIVLVFILRAPLTTVLLTLTRLKYKDLELDFGRELKQLEKEARALDIAPKQLQKTAVKREPRQFLEEAAQMADDFPEPAIAVASQAIEAELMTAVMRMGISPDYPPYNSALKNAQLLGEQNKIDSRTFELLNRMRMLRNSVTHGASRAAVKSHEAAEFVALARGVVEKLESVSR
jgi:uncharacterized protein YutE (UPF0331/DUF86 family)